MRRAWLLLPVLVVAAAWLALRGGGGRAVAPLASPSSIEAGASDVELVAIEDAARESSESDAVDLEPEPEEDAPPSEVESPLPSATLAVRALLPDGTPWAGARVQVLARSQVRRGHDRPRRNRPGSHTMSISTSGPAGHKAVADADEDGTLEWPDVVPEQPLTVQLVDPLGEAAASQSGIVLTAGERRELDLWAQRFPVVLTGRCMDESGRALPDTTLQIGNPRDDPYAVRFFLNPPVNDAGAFTTRPLCTPRVSVRARCDDLFAYEEVDLAAGVASIELVLRRGRELMVEMRDEAGDTFTDFSISVHEPGGERLELEWQAQEGGRRYLMLPRSPLELRWGGPCDEDSMLVGPEVERVLVRGRRPGVLEIEVGALPGDVQEPYVVVLHCSGSATPAFLPMSVLNTGRQSHRWTLSPGCYAIQLLHMPHQAAQDGIPWGAPVQVEVRSNETTFERLGGESNSAGSGG